MWISGARAALLSVLWLLVLALAPHATSQESKAPFERGDIVPGERIGPILLTGSIEDVMQLFGPGSLAFEEKPRTPQLFSLQSWNAIGLWVQFDANARNVIWISIETGHGKAWEDYASADGLRLGMPQEDAISQMGPPERKFTLGPATSLYYDQRGLRLTIADQGPNRGRVGSIRVVWPTIPRVDTIIVPGERISGVRLDKPASEALLQLGGGYHKGGAMPDLTDYYWPHLGLGFFERDGRIVSARAGRHAPADAWGIRYATPAGLGQGSHAAEINKAFGVPPETRLVAPGRTSWIYRNRGIAFFIDAENVVQDVDVFPPEVISPRLGR